MGKNTYLVLKITMQIASPGIKIGGGFNVGRSVSAIDIREQWQRLQSLIDGIGNG